LKTKLIAISITKSYQAGSHAISVLNGISLELAEGEFACILGPNGCGKTTLLRILSGLEKPTTGQILIDGQEIDLTDLHHHKIGVVFQEPRLLPWKTVLDNVNLVLKPIIADAKRRKETARNYLKLVQLSDFESYYPNKISGGMQQRVAIARALAIEPDILLMDEPFGALDAQNRRIMQREVQQLWRQVGKTILFITHSIEEALTIGTQVIMMSARPSTVREVFHLEPQTDREKIRETLDRMITEEVDSQQRISRG
jgi:NitT/TauT family transport system ATP-binding protein